MLVTASTYECVGQVALTSQSQFATNTVAGSRIPRHALLAVVVFALLAAVIGNQHTRALSWGSDDVETPEWQELKDQALGIVPQDVESANDEGRPDITQEVSLILSSLDLQYQLLEREENLFSDRLPAPLLTEWIHTQNIPEEHFPSYLDGLVEFCREIGNDETISRIHNTDARTRTISTALDLYTQNFRNNVENLQAEVDAAEAESEWSVSDWSDESGTMLFFLGLLLGILVTLLLTGIAVLIYVLVRKRPTQSPTSESNFEFSVSNE